MMKNPFKKRRGKSLDELHMNNIPAPPPKIPYTGKVNLEPMTEREVKMYAANSMVDVLANQVSFVGKTLRFVNDLKGDTEFLQRIDKMQKRIHEVKSSKRANLERELAQLCESYTRLKSMPSILVD